MHAALADYPRSRYRAPSIDGLTASDRAFLDAIRSGESARSYARRNNYSTKWAEWKSRAIRRRLGVATLREAVEVSEVAGLETKVADLSRKLDAALDAFAKATTPAEKESTGDRVESSASALQAELRARGLTMKDLDEKAEEKFQSRVDARVRAALEERDRVAAEEAEARAAEEASGKGKGTLDKIVDGLGGVRNVKP